MSKSIPTASTNEMARCGWCGSDPIYIAYAFMQAVGVVNDHLVSCPRHAACASMRPDLNRPI